MVALRGSQVSRNIEVRVRSAKKGVPFRPQVPLGPLSASRRWFTSSSGQLQRRKKGRTEDETSVLQGSTPRLCPRGLTAPQHASGRSVHPNPGRIPTQAAFPGPLTLIHPHAQIHTGNVISQTLLLQLFIQQASLSA